MSAELRLSLLNNPVNVNGEVVPGSPRAANQVVVNIDPAAFRLQQVQVVISQTAGVCPLPCSASLINRTVRAAREGAANFCREGDTCLKILKIACALWLASVVVGFAVGLATKHNR